MCWTLYRTSNLAKQPKKLGLGPFPGLWGDAGREGAYQIWMCRFPHVLKDRCLLRLLFVAKPAGSHLKWLLS